MSNELKLLVDYFTPRVRQAVLRCPKCKKYFMQSDVLEYSLENNHDVDMLEDAIYCGGNKFTCPVCGHTITRDNICEVEVEETTTFPKITKKVVSWE